MLLFEINPPPYLIPRFYGFVGLYLLNRRLNVSSFNVNERLGRRRGRGRGRERGGGGERERAYLPFARQSTKASSGKRTCLHGSLEHRTIYREC